MKKKKNCQYCGGRVTMIRDCLRVSWQQRSLTLKDIPLGICIKCGERYIDPHTTNNLESLFLNRATLKEA